MNGEGEQGTWWLAWRGGGVEAGMLFRSRVRSPYGTGVLDCGPGAGGCWVLEDGIFDRGGLQGRAGVVFWVNET